MKTVLIAAFVLMFFSFLPSESWAQGCSMCTKTAGQLGDKAARGLNAGILYLAAVPLVAMGTIGTIWWRRQRQLHSSQD